MAQNKLSKAFDLILSELREYGFSVTDTFLEDTFSGHSSCSFNEAYHELIHHDFRKSSYLLPSFGPSISTTDNDILQGPVVLQIISIANVSQPLKRQEEDSYPRVLLLKLNDGHSSAGAVEYERIPALTTKLAPGTKLLVTQSVPICSGKIILSRATCQVLGGKVDHLFNAWQTNRATLSSRQQKKQESSGEEPPHFELKIATPDIAHTSTAQAKDCRDVSGSNDTNSSSGSSSNSSRNINGRNDSEEDDSRINDSSGTDPSPRAVVAVCARPKRVDEDRAGGSRGRGTTVSKGRPARKGKGDWPHPVQRAECHDSDTSRLLQNTHSPSVRSTSSSSRESTTTRHTPGRTKERGGRGHGEGGRTLKYNDSISKKSTFASTAPPSSTLTPPPIPPAAAAAAATSSTSSSNSSKPRKKKYTFE